MIRILLILVLGALPSLPLALFAGYAVLIGVQMSTDNPSGAMLLVVWGLAGLYGTAALWCAAFGVRHLFVLIGLLVGCVAISPIAYWIPQSSDWQSISISSYVLFGPITTACALVGESGYGIYAGSPDKRIARARFLFALCMLAIVLSVLSVILIGRQG